MTGLLFCVFSVGLAIGVIVAVGGLLYLQVNFLVLLLSLIILYR